MRHFYLGITYELRIMYIMLNYRMGGSDDVVANNTSFQVNIPALTRYTTNQPRTFGAQINLKF